MSPASWEPSSQHCWRVGRAAERRQPACSPPQPPGPGLLSACGRPLWLSPQPCSTPSFPPSWPQQIPAQRREGASSSCCQSPAGLAQLCPDPALHPVSRDHLCSEHPCSGPCGPGRELGSRRSGPPAPACPAGPASVDSPCPSPTVWLATQNHSTLVTERSAVPFLPVNPEYSATRNQVRGLDGAWGHLFPCWVTTLWGPALPFLAGRPLFAALPHSWPRPRPGCGMWGWGGSCPVSPG